MSSGLASPGRRLRPDSRAEARPRRWPQLLFIALCLAALLWLLLRDPDAVSTWLRVLTLEARRLVRSVL